MFPQRSLGRAVATILLLEAATPILRAMVGVVTDRAVRDERTHPCRSVLQDYFSIEAADRRRHLTKSTCVRFRLYNRNSQTYSPLDRAEHLTALYCQQRYQRLSYHKPHTRAARVDPPQDPDGFNVVQRPALDSTCLVIELTGRRIGTWAGEVPNAAVPFGSLKMAAGAGVFSLVTLLQDPRPPGSYGVSTVRLQASNRNLQWGLRVSSRR